MKKMRSIAYMLVLSLGIMLLTGCGQKIGITMNSDGTGNMKMIFMIEKSSYDMVSSEFEKSFKGYGFEKGSETYKGKEYVTWTKTADFDKPGTLQKMLTDGDAMSKAFFDGTKQYSEDAVLSSCVVNTHSFQGALTGTLDRTDDKADAMDEDGFVKIAVTFPEKIAYSNGTITSSGKTAYWMLNDCMNDKLLRASTVGSSDFPKDTKVPVIGGVQNGKYYRHPLEVTLSDNVGIKSATVNGKRMGNEEEFDNDAKYVVRAADFAGNKAVKTFYVDLHAPKVTGVTNGRYYNSAKVVKWSDKLGVKSAKLNGKTVKSGVKVTSSKKHTLVVTDKAGNAKKVSFVIDTKLPTIKGVAYGKTYRSARKITFSDNIGVKSATLNGSTFRNGQTVSKSGTYTIRVKDKAGNVRSVKFTIKK